MISELKPYLAQKDSCVPWLGKVPEHWSLLPNRALFAEVRERDHPDEQMLSVTITQGVIKQRALLENSSKKDSSKLDKSAYKLVCPGDLAYNKMRAWQGAIGVSDFRGIVSPAYVIVRLRAENNPRYFHHLFRTPGFATEAERLSYGITSDMWSLRPEHFKMIYCCLPTLAEQVAIVRFTDHLSRMVQRYIRAKQKLIKVLEEQKQAIIHLAVTRGLDPTARLKPSGVGWLGDVPEHWGVIKIRNLARPGYKTFVDGDWIESPYITSDGIRLIQTGNIGIGEYREKGFRYISENTFRAFRCTEFYAGDVLICRLGDPVGRACLAPNLNIRMITSVDVCILKPRGDADPAYIVHVMSSPLYLDWVGSLVRGSTRDRVSRSMLGRFVLPLPPVQEQASIVQFLEEATADISTVVKQTLHEIALLREYRTRLIADVVTGKLDVREAAAGLPDEPEEPEPLEDTENMADARENDEDAAVNATPEEIEE